MPGAEGGLDLLKSNLGEIFVCVDSEIHSKDRTKLMQREGLTGKKPKKVSSSAWGFNSLLSRKGGKQTSSSS